MSIDPKETIARFLTASSWYSVQKNEVKFGAFLPREDDQLTSVFRIDGLSEEDSLELGKAEVLEKLQTGQRLHGRANIEADSIAIDPLGIRPETSSHALHADIFGWPADIGAQKVLAGKLAKKAQLKLLPAPLTKG